MTPNLPKPIAEVLRPLFEALPLEGAMGRLVVESPGGERVEMLEKMLADARLADKPALAAGLWLYVDELDRSHTVSQSLDSPTGAFWHAIMHRREGDFANSHYWYRRTGHHPAMSRIDIGGGSAASGTSIGNFDPHAFVDRVERCVQNDPVKCHELVSMQRHEWVALFEWCAEH